MLSTPSKNIENIAIHLHFEQKNKNPKYESPSKPKIISAANHNCERNLSPWNRKKDEQNARRISINEDPNQVTVNFSEKETDLNSSTTKKMTDFLEKIHFTNKKKNSSERKIPPHKLNKFEESKNLGEKTISDRLADLTSEEIKQIIVYKKNHKENEVSTKKKLNLKGKKNEFTEKKLTSIQNFYDPYQNKPKISRKLIKYQLKLHDELTYTTRLNDSTASYGDFQTTWRKNTAPEKVHKRNFSMPDHELNQFKNFKTENEKSMVRTFFETKTSNFSRALKTEPTERNESIRDDPEREHAEKSEEKSSPFELTYVTPSGQAIKRIKHQYKKSRKMKTEQNYYKSEHSKSEIETLKRERNFYLYQTFLNYKSKKDSSGMNITKTLGFNFHNQQTFNQNLQKVWLNSKN